MEKLTISNPEGSFHFKTMEKTITKIMIDGVDKTGLISDGYHTFDELYEHRITLYIAMCRLIDDVNRYFQTRKDIWRSKLHSDGTSFEGWFTLGIGKAPSKQITYHLPLSRWDETNFAETLERGPEFDGHTPADVLERLANL